MVRQEEQRSVVVGAIVTKQVEADMKVSLDYSSEEDEASPLQVNNCTFRHCQEEERHSPADCKYFLSLSKSQRKKEVSRKARCFLCLDRDHTAKVCSASNQVKALHLPLKFLISPLPTFCWQRLLAPTYLGGAEPARHVKNANSGPICSQQRRMPSMK